MKLLLAAALMAAVGAVAAPASVVAPARAVAPSVAATDCGVPQLKPDGPPGTRGGALLLSVGQAPACRVFCGRAWSASIAMPCLRPPTRSPAAK